MKTLRVSSRLVEAVFAVMLAGGGAVAVAAEESPATQPAPSKQMRDQMAAVHEKMAACLRSDKPFADCRSEMQASCKSMMGEHGCPMMGMGMGMGGMQERMKKNP